MGRRRMSAKKTIDGHTILEITFPLYAQFRPDEYHPWSAPVLMQSGTYSVLGEIRICGDVVRA